MISIFVAGLLLSSFFKDDDGMILALAAIACVESNAQNDNADIVEVTSVTILRGNKVLTRFMVFPQL